MVKRDNDLVEKNEDNTETLKTSNTSPLPERSSSKKAKLELPIPPVPSKPRQCHFFVKRKRRYCHLTTSLGIKYCGEHSHLLVTDNEQSSEAATEKDANPYSASGKKRIPCPFDNKHTIFEKDLEKHALRCNARPPDVLPGYFCKDLNLSIKEDIASSKLNEQPFEIVNNFLSTVSSISEKIIPEIPTSILDHPVLEHQRVKKSDVKHIGQQASIVGHLKNEGLLNPKNCFIEFGAGKGELSLYVSQALDLAFPENVPNKASEISQEQAAPFVLVDRSNFRFKFDRYLKDTDNPTEKTSRFQRVTLDIKDLDLTKLGAIKNRPVVAYSKHLCGAATDLTLNSLAHFHRSGGKIAGVVIALCCHHICSAKAYPSLQYLKKQGLLNTNDQFQWLSTMCSWATCGLRPEKAEDSKTSESNTAHFTNLSHSEREALGYNAKRSIDTGRLSFIKESLNLSPRLVRYVENNLTLENVALIATPKIDLSDSN